MRTHYGEIKCTPDMHIIVVAIQRTPELNEMTFFFLLFSMLLLLGSSSATAQNLSFLRGALLYCCGCRLQFAERGFRRISVPSCHTRLPMRGNRYALSGSGIVQKPR